MLMKLDQMPFYLKLIHASVNVLCFSCLIFTLIQWNRRRSETKFRFSQTVGHTPVLGNELLILLGILLFILSSAQLTGTVLVKKGMIVTDEHNVIFNFLASLIFYTIYFISLHSLLKKREISLLAAFGLTWGSLKSGWRVALVGLGAALVPVGISGALAQWFFEKMGLSIELQNLMRLFLSIENPFLRLAIGVIAVIGAPIVEETLFRGILYPTLKKRLGFGLAVFLTSALFAAVHYHALTALPLTILAIALTLVYEWRGNLASCILMHALFNLTTLVNSILFGKYEDLSVLPPYFP
jgi:membrane protease YdiL (CAAX protease family)